MNYRKFFCLLIVFCLLLTSLLQPVTALATGFSQAERVYFFNMAGNKAGDGDFIIVESEGHFGLIDAGHRYADTIQDADGTVYAAESSRNLSSQVPYKNGRDAAQYMIDSLGITHLDFIVGTHSHSDHIGGVPEIAELTFTDENGDTRHLVDENTVYLYKNYQHINDVQDDIQIHNRSVIDEKGCVKTWSWHNQAYVYQAVHSMQERGCAVAELSNGIHVSAATQAKADYSGVVAAINSVDGLSCAHYYRGALNDYYDDFVIFQMGKLSIRLYNLFVTDTVTDDNVNSLVALVTDGSTKVVSLSDINVEKRTEQKLAKAIYDDVGTADLVKAAHHGAVRGSNSREMLEYLQPQNMVVTRSKDYVVGSNGRGSFSAAMVYARNHYNTTFYEVGASDFGVVAEFAKGKVNLYNLTGTGSNTALTSPQQCVSKLVPVNGWSHWTVEMGDPDTEELCYLRDGVQVAAWYTEDEQWWYYINEHSQMQYGWLYLNGGYYYLATDATADYPRGAMVTGWNYIDGNWYFFGDSGKLANGWTETAEGWYYFDNNASYLKNGWYKISGYWYYFNAKGILQTGWLKLGGKQYYLDEKGSMQTGWLRLNGVWYYFDTNGVMTVGWCKIAGQWYYFKGDGKMATGWQKSAGKWYYFNNNGAMQTGWKKISEKWYYFNADGAMQTGWMKDSDWYYFTSSGVMKTDWLYQNGKWYYFAGSGAMVTGSKTISGKQYTFNTSGVWVK